MSGSRTVAASSRPSFEGRPTSPIEGLGGSSRQPSQFELDDNPRPARAASAWRHRAALVLNHDSALLASAASGFAAGFAATRSLQGKATPAETAGVGVASGALGCGALWAEGRSALTGGNAGHEVSDPVWCGVSALGGAAAGVGAGLLADRINALTGGLVLTVGLCTEAATAIGWLVRGMPDRGTADASHA